MIVLNDVTVSAVETYKTRTHLSTITTAGSTALDAEISITTFSRLIDGKMRYMEVQDATLQRVEAISRLDDGMFKFFTNDD